jgi:hypothetical protein
VDAANPFAWTNHVKHVIVNCKYQASSDIKKDVASAADRWNHELMESKSSSKKMMMLKINA